MVRSEIVYLLWRVIKAHMYDLSFYKNKIADTMWPKQLSSTEAIYYETYCVVNVNQLARILCKHMPVSSYSVYVIINRFSYSYLGVAVRAYNLSQLMRNDLNWYLDLFGIL